jgi:hypothetical protein
MRLRHAYASVSMAPKPGCLLAIGRLSIMPAAPSGRAAARRWYSTACTRSRTEDRVTSHRYTKVPSVPATPTRSSFAWTGTAEGSMPRFLMGRYARSGSKSFGPCCGVNHTIPLALGPKPVVSGRRIGRRGCGSPRITECPRSSSAAGAWGVTGGTRLVTGMMCPLVGRKNPHGRGTCPS